MVYRGAQTCTGETNMVVVGSKDHRCCMGHNPNSTGVNGNLLSSATTQEVTCSVVAFGFAFVQVL